MREVVTDRLEEVEKNGLIGKEKFFNARSQNLRPQTDLAGDDYVATYCRSHYCSVYSGLVRGWTWVLGWYQKHGRIEQVRSGKSEGMVETIRGDKGR